MIYQVDEEFIKEAYKAACTDWKEKLRVKFPKIFKPSVIQRVEETEEHKNFRRYREIEVVDGDLIIPLPSANDGWTKAAWKLALKVLEIYPDAYPQHRDDEGRVIRIVGFPK